MPYRYIQSQSGYNVYNEDTDELVIHVDGSEEDVKKYIRALYANEKKELSNEQIKDMIHRLISESLDEESKSWFWIEESYSDHMIVNFENIQRYAVYFHKHEDESISIIEIVPVTKKYVPILQEKQKLFEAIKEFVTGKKKMKQGFYTIKDKEGHYRWIAVSSSAHRDRDREIISTKALNEDVVRNEEAKEHGYLNYWHVPELIVGNCDFRMMAGRMLVESGVIFNEKVAKALEKKEHKVSIEFYHPENEPDEHNVYHNVIISGRAVLPSGAAANPFTTIKGVTNMKTQEEKIQEFVELLGGDEEAQEIASGILKEAESIQKEADQLADFKEAKMDEELKTEDDDEKKKKPVKKDEEEQEDMKKEIKEIINSAIEEKINEVMVEYAKKEKEAQDQRIEEFTEALKQVADKIKTLEDDMPAVAKGYVASAADDNLVKDGDEILDSKSKETYDPFLDLMTNLGISKE